MIKTKLQNFAVLFDRGPDLFLLDRTGEHYIPRTGAFPLWTLKRVLEMAKYYGPKAMQRGEAFTLWITPESDFWRGIVNANKPNGNYRHFFNSRGDWEVRPVPNIETSKPAIEGRSVLSAWNESSYRVRLIIPRLGNETSDWALEDLTDPYALFNAIEYFHEKLGVEPTFRFEAARTLFERSKPGGFQKLSDENEKYFGPFLEKPESDIIWIRQPGKSEKAKKFVHAFDKRAMYLTAARNTFAGAGHYETVEDVWLRDIPKNAAGLVELDPLKFPTGAILADWFKGQTRFYLPLLRALAEDPEILPGKIKKAWIWKDTGRLFERFSGQLIDAIKDSRESNLEEIQAANKAFKSMYVSFFGWFGRACECSRCNTIGSDPAGCKRNGWKAELFRPDWRAAIISMAKANLLRNIRQVSQWTNGLEPFAINHDCIMYFSEFENPAHEFGGSDVMQANKFTHEWTLPAKKVLSLLKDGAGPAMIDATGKSEGMQNV